MIRLLAIVVMALFLVGCGSEGGSTQTRRVVVDGVQCIEQYDEWIGQWKIVSCDWSTGEQS